MTRPGDTVASNPAEMRTIDKAAPRPGRPNPNLMKENGGLTTHIQEDKGSQGDENEPRASLELVIKTDISSMPEIVRVVEQVAHTKILYQRVSGGRLRIVTEE